MEQWGAKRVELTGLNDKCQITAVFCGTLSGDFLSAQLVYQGKTERCHPRYLFSKAWHITQLPNYWSTEETMKDYITEIIIPYVKAVRENSGLDDDYQALATIDNF